MKFVATEEAPKAIGPYSKAVVEGGFLFAAGQIPLDPKTGEFVSGGIDPSAERVLDNLEAVLKAAGAAFSDVVKTTVYLTKVEDFAALNGLRQTHGRPQTGPLDRHRRGPAEKRADRDRGDVGAHRQAEALDRVASQRMVVSPLPLREKPGELGSSPSLRYRSSIGDRSRLRS